MPQLTTWCSHSLQRRTSSERDDPIQLQVAGEAVAGETMSPSAGKDPVQVRWASVKRQE